MLNTLDTHPTFLGNYSLSALLSCRRGAIVRRGWERSWGEDGEGGRERIRKGLLRRDGAMRVKRYEVERYGVESYRVENGTKKESFEDFSSKLSHIKEGGYLLSRIALQYHRRRRA